MNYFDHVSAAKRYSQSRPYFQPQVIDIVRQRLQLNTKLEQALDVACGTGHSAKALLGIANEVTATDLSNAMLAEVESQSDITFQQASAEKLPFDDNHFDILTVSMAYHWFDQKRFLAEAKRVLKRSGTLVIYNSYFPGIMEGNERFSAANNAYYSTFPAPTRSDKHPTDVDAKAFGFIGKKTDFNFSVHWNLNQLTDYLCTQSAVIDQVEQGDCLLEDVTLDITKRFASFFLSERETFLFKGDVSIWTF
jgi:ubiquinone/menaquinone biosynthesis C-methylase UbiE